MLISAVVVNCVAALNADVDVIRGANAAEMQIINRQ